MNRTLRLAMAVIAVLTLPIETILADWDKRFNLDRNGQPLVEWSDEPWCEAAQLTAASHYHRCLTRAINKAIIRDRKLSEDDIARCDKRFDRTLERVEGRFACRTPGGPSTLREQVQAQVLTTAQSLKGVLDCTTTSDTAVCKVQRNVSALDLSLVVNQLSNLGVTNDTIFWIQAWGGNGSNGNVCCNEGGMGGISGYAQTSTTLTAFLNAYKQTDLYYYLGYNGTFSANAGGDGGTATLVTLNDLTEEKLDLNDTLLMAAGGGGGGAGRGKAGACGGVEVIFGEDGGAGATVLGASGATNVVAGEGGTEDLDPPGKSGKGGQVDSGGSGNGGSSKSGGGPTAPLGGRGGNHNNPQIGFVNSSGIMVTGGGGQGSDGGNDDGGGGGGGGYTGGGGGDRGVSSTQCRSGGGGGGSSFVRNVPNSPSCSAVPSKRPDNPNGARGFVQLTFDLGACQ